MLETRVPSNRANKPQPQESMNTQPKITRWTRSRPHGEETQVEGFISWGADNKLPRVLGIRESRLAPGIYDGWKKKCSFEEGTKFDSSCLGKLHRFVLMKYRTTNRILSVEHLH